VSPSSDNTTVIIGAWSALRSMIIPRLVDVLCLALLHQLGRSRMVLLHGRRMAFFSYGAAWIWCGYWISIARRRDDYFTNYE